MKVFQKILRFACIMTLFLCVTTVQAQSVIEKLKSNSQTTQFARALENAGIGDRLSQPGPYTVFAPTNQTFSNLSTGQQSDSNLLLNHILTGMATVRSLRVMSDISCLSGKRISVQSSGSGLAVENNQITSPNIKANNGVIHIINGVIE
ncbi:fasciclin domain-containing protein [Fodinibius sp. Rm-B-1B1-1]|uniref:fasciclin domain-containing protein n=1 Tax=Fodinibius alkaliphilus TaxID=3140241 RepID=UPI00315A070A